MVNGAIKIIRFKGGIMSPRRVNGILTTPDPDLQKAIEEAPGFGKRWVLHKDWGEQEEINPALDDDVVEPVTTGPHNATEEATVTGPTPEVSTAVVKDEGNDDLAENVPEVKEAPEAKPDPEVKEDPVPVTGPTPEVLPEEVKYPPVVNKEVTSGQKARNFLVKHFDDVKVSMLRNNTQIRALAKERNVGFPKWPKE